MIDNYSYYIFECVFLTQVNLYNSVYLLLRACVPSASSASRQVWND